MDVYIQTYKIDSLPANYRTCGVEEHGLVSSLGSEVCQRDLREFLHTMWFVSPDESTE